jgi:hypothetical protein
MTKNFDYKNCNLEELADYVEESPAQRITTTLIYYQKRNDNEMVDKIKRARAVVKKRKLIRMLENLECEK